MKNMPLHTNKSSGFKTPEAYFESFEEVVISKLTEQQINSKLESHGFKVPEGYFESFDTKVLDSIQISKPSKVVPLFHWKKIAYISGIAASIFLIINLFLTNSHQLTFENLETASIENYLIDQEMNAYDIAPYLGARDLNADDFVENTLNASEIEDYLLQNSDVEHLIID